MVLPHRPWLLWGRALHPALQGPRCYQCPHAAAPRRSGCNAGIIGNTNPTDVPDGVCNNRPAVPAATQPLPSVATQPPLSVAVLTGLFLGDGVLPLPQRLMKKIIALEFVEMRELLPEEWLSSMEEGEQDSHSCCNSAAKK